MLPSQSGAASGSAGAPTSPLVVAGDAHPARRCRPTSRAAGRTARRARHRRARFSAWSGLASASVPTSRFSQPDRTDEPGVGVLDLLHRGEVRAVGRRQPGRVHGGHLAGGPERQQRLEARVQAEHAVLGQQRRRRRRRCWAERRSTPGRRAGRRGSGRRRPRASTATTRTAGAGAAAAGRGRHDGGAEDGRGRADGERAGEQAAPAEGGVLGTAVWSGVHAGVTCSGSRGSRGRWSAGGACPTARARAPGRSISFGLQPVASQQACSRRSDARRVQQLAGEVLDEVGEPDAHLRQPVRPACGSACPWSATSRR